MLNSFGKMKPTISIFTCLLLIMSMISCSSILIHLLQCLLGCLPDRVIIQYVITMKGLIRKWDRMPHNLQKPYVFSAPCSLCTGMIRLLLHWRRKMDYGVQQITSAMSLNWSFSTMSPLSGMKRGCFTQRSATIPVNIAANNGFAIHISPVK